MQYVNVVEGSAYTRRDIQCLKQSENTAISKEIFEIFKYHFLNNSKL